MDEAWQAGAPDSASDPNVLLEEVKGLVKSLYDPNGRTPAELKSIQERLQEIQKLPQGWQIADGLVNANDTDLRFFGALTFTVKINQSCGELSDTELQQLKPHLTQCFIALVAQNEKALVVRKMASALVALFFKHASWTRAIWDLAASMSNQKQLPNEEYLVVDFEGAALPPLNQQQILALLRFSTTMAEEAIKNSALVRKDGDHPVSDNVKDAFCLGDYVLRQLLRQYGQGGRLTDLSSGMEAIESYRAWLAVRATIRLRQSDMQNELSNPIDRLLQCLTINGLTRSITEILTDLVKSEDKLLSDYHFDAICEFFCSDSGTGYVVRLMEGDYDEDGMAILDLVLAYSSSRRMSLVFQAPTPKHSKILSYLDTLIHSPGFPGAEDKVSPALLEWWTETADECQYLNPDETSETQMHQARQNLAQAVLNCFERLIYPSREKLLQWDDDERSEFQAFRRDAQDFLLAVYPTLGVELVQLFQQRANSALDGEDWSLFEVSIFCLVQLSETVDGNDLASECLNQLFFADKFAAVCSGAVAEFPSKARQTLVDMLGKYEVFFERAQELLPRVLTFLFSSLIVRSCSNAASKSISSLCSSCRRGLTAELPVFLSLFSDFHQHSTATIESLERVVQGVAAVIQALPTDEAKVPYLEQLLEPFFMHALAAPVQLSAGNVEDAMSRAHFCLTCIGAVGQGLRTDVIDLDRDEGADDDNSFWASHPIQQRLIQCLQLFFNTFPLDLCLVEDICKIVKAGLTEKTGPFVFSTKTTVSLLTSIPLGTNGAADITMSTASSFLASHSAHSTAIQEEAGLLVIHVYNAFSFMVENPTQNDPEVASSGIGFLTRLLPKYFHVLFSMTGPPQPRMLPTTGSRRPPVLSTLLDFTIQVLRGADPLPLRSAAQFWVGVLNLANSLRAVSEVVRSYLPVICHVVITQLAGGCARSDIMHLCEVLKKIVFKYQGAARPHLEAALASLAGYPGNNATSPAPEHVPSSMTSEQARFLAMVLGARGSSATNDIVRSFWIKSRGAGFDYTA